MDIVLGIALDALLLLWLITRVVGGVREGLLVGIYSVSGTLIGALAGFFFADDVVAAVPALMASRGLRMFSILFIILLLSWLGFLLLRALGRRFRGEEEATGIDSVLGGVASFLVTSLIMWALLAAVHPLAPMGFGRVIERSFVYEAMSKVVPQRFHNVPLQAFNSVVDYLPHVFDGEEPNLPAAPPDVESTTGSQVAQASASVMKIASTSPACSSNSAGSGWVVAPERVVTNAHVIAGSESVTVSAMGSGPQLSATVVAMDPATDLAILAVPGLDARPLLRESDTLADGTSTVAAGFPWGGDFTLSPSRVRGVTKAVGSDIYGNPNNEREVYALRTDVHPGNSGGPLLTTDGEVAGTIFAMSSVDSQTGYALTDDQSSFLLDNASAFTQPVATGGCVAS